jgi:hypothetical protein
MSNWLYENSEILEISQLPQDTVGFVYKITHKASGKFYIGKKILHSTRNKTLTKTEIAQWDKPGRVPKKRKVVTESDWQGYWGSSKTLAAAVKEFGKSAFTREIIKPCKSKKSLSYYEVYFQITFNVLEVDSYCDNISGKWFRKDLL